MIHTYQYAPKYDSINDESCHIALKFTTPQERLLCNKIEGLDRASNNYYNKGSYVTLKIVLGLLVEEAKKMLSGLVYMSSSKCSGSILGEVLLIGCTKEVDVQSRASEVDLVWYGVNTLCKECKNYEPRRNHKINEI